MLYKSNCIIFIFSWCATHTKIRSKLVVIVTAGSQKITLWGPQWTPLGILRVKRNVIWGCGLDSSGSGRSGFLKKCNTLSVATRGGGIEQKNEFQILSKILRSMKKVSYVFNCRTQWLRGLRRGSAAASFFWNCGFESRRGHGYSSIVVCCQAEVSATSWSLVQSSPTGCGASLYAIYKPQELGGHGQRWVACYQLDAEYTIRGLVW